MADSSEAVLALDVTVPVNTPPAGATPLPGLAEIRQGARVDHFLIGDKIGFGGMGTIFAARDLALDRPVALKFLPRDLARDVEAQERFIREAQAQARLRSPRVVQIFFIGRAPRSDATSTPLPVSSGPAISEVRPTAASPSAEGALYFAMELVDGESLEATLNRGEKLDPEEARTLMIQVAQGLGDAHRAGIVHRDIKPANLLIDERRHLKIADFGLAKPRDPNLALTREGTVMGTPYYMAPEQALGEPLDHRADMYGLGATFYHLLAGEPPFDGPNSVAVISKHLSSAPPPLAEREPRVPKALAAIIDRLLAKKPVERYATYEELIAALEAAAPTRVEYAGFWVRAAAATLDAILASALIGALGWIGLLVHITYTTAGHAYYGKTLGKHALRLEVQSVSGERIGPRRAIERTLSAMWLPILMGLEIAWTEGVSGLKGSIVQLSRVEGAKSIIGAILISHVVLAFLYAGGFVVTALSRQKRALHDIIAGTQVVYRLAQGARPR